jgi:hypothetical protein
MVIVWHTPVPSSTTNGGGVKFPSCVDHCGTLRDLTACHLSIEHRSRVVAFWLPIWKVPASNLSPRRIFQACPSREVGSPTRQFPCTRSDRAAIRCYAVSANGGSSCQCSADPCRFLQARRQVARDTKTHWQALVPQLRREVKCTFECRPF